MEKGSTTHKYKILIIFYIYFYYFNKLDNLLYVVI